MSQSIFVAMEASTAFLAAPAIQVNICVVRWLIQAPLQKKMIRDDCNE